MANASAMDEDIKAQAREWLLRLSLEPPSPAAQGKFESWCAADPQHAKAYQRFEAIWEDAEKLDHLKSLAAIEADRTSGITHQTRRIPAWTWATGIAAALAVVFVGLRILAVPTHFATGIAEIREIRLSDGSEVTLGARSSMDVAFRDEVRQVALTSGEAFFSVTKNSRRPFLVLVGDKQVRVVGTKFEIRRSDSDLRVSVVEGTVEVMQAPVRADGTVSTLPKVLRLHAESSHPAAVTLPNSPEPAPGAATPVELRLTAGEQVTATIAGAIDAPRAMPHAEPAAWRNGRLVYVDATLREVVADANRYSNQIIRVDDDQVADLRISVTYPSDRVSEMLSALARSLSLDVEQGGSGEILLKAKPPSH